MTFIALFQMEDTNKTKNESTYNKIKIINQIIMRKTFTQFSFGKCKIYPHAAFILY